MITLIAIGVATVGMVAMMSEILLVLHGAIPHRRLSFFRRLHLRLIMLVVACLERWKEVDRVTDDIESVYKGNDPLQDGGSVILVQLGGGSESNRKGNLG